MKTLALLVNFHRYPSRELLWDGKTATERLRALVQSLEPEAPILEIGPFKDTTEYLEALVTACQGWEEAVFFAADAPYTRADVSSQLLHLHRRYRAEYTFADGFPSGLTPEVLHPRILPTLLEWSKKKPSPAGRESLFQLLSTDINRFDVETHLSPVDLRSRRLSLTADSARGVLLLRRVEPWNSLPLKEFLDNLEKMGALVRTLPATLQVQVTNGVRQVPQWSPHLQFDPRALEARDFLSRQNWNRLLDSMLSFAGDLTVMPGFWGEPSMHPQICGLLSDALAKPGLALCIETSGLGWREDDLLLLSRESRGNLEFIVELDSLVPETYLRLRGDGFEEALATTLRLIELFPGKVWPQTVRMLENEDEMEGFYKYWTEKAGRVILQKHNHFGGRLPQLKPADLSPWARHPCWHAARDLAVFLDGTTVPCRDDFARTQVLGNAFSETPEVIWNRGSTLFGLHLSQNYPSVCRNCDEYYTFNY
jgi:hypothetical protein